MHQPTIGSMNYKSISGFAKKYMEWIAEELDEDTVCSVLCFTGLRGNFYHGLSNIDFEI
jgi:hypothetical protein